MARIVQYIKDNVSLIVLICIIISMSLISPFFRSPENFVTVLIQASTSLVMACGMTFAIISGEFDLSIGSTMALAGLVSIIFEPTLGQFGSILLALVAGLLVGLINGVLINYVRISSFIVTIGTMSFVKGIALKISGGKPIISQNAWFHKIGSGSVFGIPNLIIFSFGLLLISHLVLRRSRFGRNVYLIGGSREVSINSGIKVKLYGTIVFLISSFTAAVGGILLASRLNAGSALYGDTSALTVISGVVIGGTSLSGGKGSIVKSMIGIFIITLISNSLDILKVFSYYQMVIRGLLIIAIISFDAYSRYRTNLLKKN